MIYDTHLLHICWAAQNELLGREKKLRVVSIRPTFSRQWPCSWKAWRIAEHPLSTLCMQPLFWAITSMDTHSKELASPVPHRYYHFPRFIRIVWSNCYYYVLPPLLPTIPKLYWKTYELIQLKISCLMCVDFFFSLIWGRSSYCMSTYWFVSLINYTEKYSINPKWGC